MKRVNEGEMNSFGNKEYFSRIGIQPKVKKSYEHTPVAFANSFC
jgi:hypothetical protein